jgi:hypothetical protein
MAARVFYVRCTSVVCVYDYEYFVSVALHVVCNVTDNYWLCLYELEFHQGIGHRDVLVRSA